jgi:hypothetical protein
LGRGKSGRAFGTVFVGEAGGNARRIPHVRWGGSPEINIDERHSRPEAQGYLFLFAPNRSWRRKTKELRGIVDQDFSSCQIIRRYDPQKIK